METKQTIQTQLLEFQKKVTVIKKDAKNPHFKNTYASLTQIISEVKPLLSEVGIVLTQPIINGNVSTMLTFGSEVLESSIPLPVGLQPQPLGSAITYFRRYTLASLLALEIDDDDANEATKKEPVKEVAKTLQVTTTELPPLSDKAFAAMLDAITKGEKDKVKLAMTKYTLLKPQLDELTKLLN
jgi:hypothetical protein